MNATQLSTDDFSEFYAWVNKRFGDVIEDIADSENPEFIKSLSVIDTAEKRCLAYSNFKKDIWMVVEYLWLSAGGDPRNEIDKQIDRQITSIFPDTIAANELIFTGEHFKSVMLIIAINTVAKLITNKPLWPTVEEVSNEEENG